MGASMHSLGLIRNLTVCTASQPAQSFWHSQIPIMLRLAIFHLPSDLCTSTSSSFLMRHSAAYTLAWLVLRLRAPTPIEMSGANSANHSTQRLVSPSNTWSRSILEPLITYGAQITHNSPHNVPFISASMGLLHRTLTTPKA